MGAPDANDGEESALRCCSTSAVNTRPDPSSTNAAARECAGSLWGAAAEVGGKDTVAGAGATAGASARVRH